MNRLHRLAATAALGLIAPLAFATTARADESAQIEARVGAWGRNCKNAIAEKFKAKTMADVEVTLAESIRASIDAGEITLNDVKHGGLSYNFRVHHLPGKDPSGYCMTDGEGTVVDVKAVH